MGCEVWPTFEDEKLKETNICLPLGITITRGGETLVITPKDMSILSTFLKNVYEHPAKPFTKPIPCTIHASYIDTDNVEYKVVGEFA